MQYCFLLSRKSLRFLGSAMGIAIANRKNRCNFGALSLLGSQRNIDSFRHRIWPGERSTVQWKNDPRPRSLKPLLFPPLLNKVQNKGTQGVQARYGAKLPPFTSIVRHPGRPVILSEVSKRGWRERQPLFETSDIGHGSFDSKTRWARKKGSLRKGSFRWRNLWHLWHLYLL